MLIAPQSVFDCFEHIEAAQQGKRKLNIYMSPAGRVLSQEMAAELAEYDEINILCGHYEGVDQRILDAKIDREISIGDYVLTGGELPAMVLMDCVMRHIPGVLGNEHSAEGESFSMKGCWNIRSIPGRRILEVCRRRRCCFPGITPTLSPGSERWPLKRRRKTDRIF